MNNRFESKFVRLQDHPFLLGLTEQGFIWHGYSPDRRIRIIAYEGQHNDWAAYFETPFTPAGKVLHYGNKLPQSAAEDLFPGWAQSDLKWRA